jgi:polyhydroxybutyrate depolymerase
MRVRPTTVATLSIVLAFATSFACSSSSDRGASSGGSSTSSGSGGPVVDASDAGEASTVAPDAAPPIDVDVSTGQMDFGGKTRKYTLAVPVDYSAARSYPLVMSFHGEPATGASQQQAFPFEAASKRDAIVVYPDGDGNHWDLYTATDQNADMPWIKALVDELASKYSIDKTRVLGTGYSNGSFFINQMACRFAGFFKAIAPNAGGAPNEDTIGGAKDGQGFLICPGGPIPTFVFHGDQDGTVSIASGAYDAFYWSHVNGCQVPSGSLSDGTPVPTTDRAPAPCKQYDGCGKPVTWCLFPGLGHWVAPNGAQIAWQYFNALP